MNETIYAIQEMICDKLYTCAKCPYNRGKCKAHDYASCIYTAHVKPLEDALEDAQKQNAHTLGIEAAKMVASIMGAVSGNENAVQVSLGGARCPYCNHVSATMEEATEHDGICPKHPGVIRAVVAEDALASAKERERVLVEALEDLLKDYVEMSECVSGGVWTQNWWQREKARAAIASVKESTNV